MSMDIIMQYLPLLIPILVIQYALAIIAIVHIVRHKKFKIGNMLIWIIVSIVFQIVGPILYFTIGRTEDE